MSTHPNGTSTFTVTDPTDWALSRVVLNERKNPYCNNCLVSKFRWQQSTRQTHSRHTVVRRVPKYTKPHHNVCWSAATAWNTQTANELWQQPVTQLMNANDIWHLVRTTRWLAVLYRQQDQLCQQQHSLIQFNYNPASVFWCIFSFNE